MSDVARRHTTRHVRTAILSSNSQKILGEKKESESSLQVLHAEMHAWLHRPAYLTFPDTTFPARRRDGRNLAYGNTIGYQDSSVDVIVKG